jgi:hypothetical protein
MTIHHGGTESEQMECWNTGILGKIHGPNPLFHSPPIPISFLFWSFPSFHHSIKVWLCLCGEEPIWAAQGKI